MHTDRTAILSLVALGKITPREAERLLAVSRDSDETILRLALCLAFAGLALPYFGDAISAATHALNLLLPLVERALFLMGGLS